MYVKGGRKHWNRSSILWNLNGDKALLSDKLTFKKVSPSHSGVSGGRGAGGGGREKRKKERKRIAAGVRVVGLKKAKKWRLFCRLERSYPLRLKTSQFLLSRATQPLLAGAERSWARLILRWRLWRTYEHELLCKNTAWLTWVDYLFSVLIDRK